MLKIDVSVSANIEQFLSVYSYHVLHDAILNRIDLTDVTIYCKI